MACAGTPWDPRSEMRALVIGGVLGVGLAGCYAWPESVELVEPPSERSLPEMTPSVPTVPVGEPVEDDDAVEADEASTAPEPSLDAIEAFAVALKVPVQDLFATTKSDMKRH